MSPFMRPLKTFFLRTYGCQMNELDSEIMAGTLTRRGLSRADEAEADLLIYNTCSIRDLAERKVMGKLGILGKSSERPIIGVTGCMANAKKEKLLEKFPHVDFVLGTNNIGDLDAALDAVLEERRVCKTDSLFEENLDYLATVRDDPVKAHVSIIRGCDKFCTYCVVPYTRGAEVCRPAESILEEIRHLAAKGYREITLLGQNVNSYQNFPDLLYRIDKIDGIERVRFLTSHPVDITRALMEAIRDLPSLCEFVHFPLQAGSDRILRKMNRLYTRELYFEKVALLRTLVPEVKLGTDIIVGFPTETEAEFEETVSALRQIRYSAAFLYTYSPRKGTPAIRWRDDVPEEEKARRLHTLLELQEAIANEERQTFLGRDVEVLVERCDQGLLKGRTRCWKKVAFPGDPSAIGTLQRVRIHSFASETLLGTPIPQPQLQII